MVDENIPIEPPLVKDSFTRAPWFVETSEGRGDLCVLSATTWICGELDNQRDHRIESAEATANAYLIAAAPDLLEALEYAMLLIKESPGANELYRAAAERKAKSAIAKARTSVLLTTST